MKLEELCQITSSKRIHVSDYTENGVPFYRGKEIVEKQKGISEVSTELFISNDYFAELQERFGAPEAGDLLLTSVGTLGIPYVVQDEAPFYFKDGNLTWFKDFRVLDSKYLYHWILSPQGKDSLLGNKIGGLQSALTIRGLNSVQVPIPSISEQGIISKNIEAKINDIKLLEASIQQEADTIEAMPAALLRKAFSGGLV